MQDLLPFNSIGCVWINVSYWILKGTEDNVKDLELADSLEKPKRGICGPAIRWFISSPSPVASSPAVPWCLPSRRGSTPGTSSARTARSRNGRRPACEGSCRRGERHQRRRTRREGGKKKSGMSYITGQLDRDTHKDPDTDAGRRDPRQRHETRSPRGAVLPLRPDLHGHRRPRSRTARTTSPTPWGPSRLLMWPTRRGK